MKKITSIILLLIAFSMGYGQTTLSAGDIAITGVNSDDPDQFSFVLLKDVTSGTAISPADNGWQDSGSFRTGEGTLTWTATSDLSCGTEVIVTDNSPFSASVGSITDSGLFALSIDGDQVLAYQGTLSTPTFLYAVHFATTGGWTNASSSNTSAVPLGLTDGTNAVFFGNFDNGSYDCSVSEISSLILAAVSNSGNWNTTNINSRPTLNACGSLSCYATCATTVTWNGTSWSATPDITTALIIDGNYSTGTNGNLIGCSLTVNSGFTLTVDNDTYLEIENDVFIDGNIVVESRGNLVQNANTGLFIVNGSGSSSVNKITATKQDWYYYTYWSSPVENETIEDAFPFTPADRRFWFNADNYLDEGGNNIDDNGDVWTIANGTDVMTPGVGYAATSSKLGFYPSTDIATFTGIFNTGNIQVPISYNSANIAGSWNFIGNPYPSAIDFDAFHAANSSVVDGAVYFWSQASPPLNTNPGNQQNNFSTNDYAVYSVGLGAGTAGASGVIPDQYVPSGQSFFVVGLVSGNATFTNTMRMADGTSNSQFFKGVKSKKSNKINLNKLWVNLTSDNGVFNQVLVGYVDGATNNDDGMYYDAPKLLSDESAILYSKIENSDNSFAIQGKALSSLNENEIINLGFKTSIDVATLYKLSVAKIQGDFLTNNPIYIKDNLLNKVHDLSESDYTFTSEVGEFNDRFEIVFNNALLSTNEATFNKNDLHIIEFDNDQIQFSISEALKIKSVSIYDLLGRNLYNFKTDSNKEVFRLSNLNGSYIAKVELSNGHIIVKKAIKK